MFWLHYVGKPQKIPSSKVNGDRSFSIPCIDETKLSQDIAANKPLRDGKCILTLI